MGHTLSLGGFSPLHRNVQAVKEMPEPVDISQLRSFLEGVGHYRRFIANFADLAEPLHSLTRKDTEWDWKPTHQRSFEELRSRLLEAPLLRVPVRDKHFELWTDASQVAMGAVLQQDNQPVAYWSKGFTDVQRRYSATERELAAVVYAVRHFYPYLGDRRFTLVTDHSALRWLATMKETANQRISTWLATINSFDFTIRHQPGRLLAPADMLSRMVGGGVEGESKENTQTVAPVTRRRGELTGLRIDIPNVIWKEDSSSGSTRVRIESRTRPSATGESRYRVYDGTRIKTIPEALLRSFLPHEENFRSTQAT
ncbi:MAG: ribonuclease H family protein, partial [Bacteroidota bacterium]